MIEYPAIRSNLAAIRADILHVWKWYEGDRLPLTIDQEVKLTAYLSELAELTNALRERVTMSEGGP